MTRASSVVRRVLLAPIRFYQRAISPLLGPKCRYHPSCSAYAAEAIEKRGAVIGSLKALWRLLRCNPLFRGGYDPVDPADRARVQHLLEREQV